ncbi:MAG: hypothetical protein WB421_14670 [Terriglobales bacterium]
MRVQYATITLSLGIILLTAAGMATDAKAPAPQDKSCGPPNYCARTDRKVEPYPATPPKIGPAGSSVTDPNFGTRILRVTDNKTDSKRDGGALMTPSSAEQNSWNSTSTRFYVETSGGQYLLYDFDPATMTAHQSHSLGTAWGGEPQFGYTQPNMMYGFGPRSTEFQQYDASNDKVTILHNITSCVKLEADDIGHSITVSADDNRMETGVGPKQGENYIVYIYDRQKGCRWYNTKTGEIGGKWGPTGTTPMPDRFTIHNVRMSKSGKYVYVARANPQPRHHWVIWEVDTMNVVICPSECSGHRALGYSHLLGPSGQSHPMDLLIRPLNNLEESRQLIPGLGRTDGYWYDQHFSWNNANPDDTNPICLSTYRPSNPDTPGTPLAVDGPWENEVLCVATDGKDSKVWRFAHTFSTAKNGFWSTPRGNVSPDGRFFMFTSDWEDQLGETPNGKKYRTDVFIIELK